MEKAYNEFKEEKLRSIVFDALATIAQEEDASAAEMERAVEWFLAHADDVM